ncbi:MAG: trypsin-like peptidase domain-containing protein [Eubacterium sp.]|nr:trypsin-like peptidase domain-containing protein [Eubacterium sp.]
MANEYDSNNLNQENKREENGYSGYSGMNGMRYTSPYTSNGYGSNTSSNTPPNGPQPNNQNMNHTKPPKQKSKKNGMGKTIGKTAAIAAVFGLVAGGAFQGVNYGVSRFRGDEPVYESVEGDDSAKIDDDSISYAAEEATEEDAKSTDMAANDDSKVSTTKIAQQEQAASVSYDVANIVKKAQPSIVSITTTVTQSYQYFFQNYEKDATGAGSGIIIGQNDDVLYVASNYHVIDGAKEIKVGFNDGEIVDAEVKGFDASEDIAVVAVKLSDMKDSTKNSITVANVGDSDALQVGEPAIAIGNALGYGQSVTVGYISALNRTIEDSDGSYIQTDAAINPGNSGGALINSSGQVIGINSVKYVDSTVEGMGFSIPINTAMAIINDIIEGKQEGNAYLGINGEAISREYAQIYGFPTGVYVKEVKDGSPADAAGLHPGDIISKFNDKDITSNDDLQSALREKKAGETVEIVVYRADNMGYYEETKLSVTLAAETP